MLVYVAHPYGGEERNKKDVENIIKCWTKTHDKNVIFISPIHAFGYMYNDFSYEVGMDMCLELLRKCDYLIVCKGWEKSRGCNMEVDCAKENNIPIVFFQK